MTTLEKVRAKLARFPQARIETTATSISVLPTVPSGFVVTLSLTDNRFTVSFDGWHEHFDSEDEAIACFGFGLSSRCRLAITLRGATPVKWTVESNHDGSWTPDSETGLLLVPFWKSKQVVYRSNTLTDRPAHSETNETENVS